jgi:hypothetical protein
MASADGLCTLAAGHRAGRLKILWMGFKTGGGRNVERTCRPRTGHPVNGLCPARTRGCPFFETGHGPAQAVLRILWMGCKTGEGRNFERGSRLRSGHPIRGPCPFEDGVSVFPERVRRPAQAVLRILWMGYEMGDGRNLERARRPRPAHPMRGQVCLRTAFPVSKTD